MKSWPLLRTVHLLVGVAGLGAFLATGLFMDRRLDHLVGMADGPRALYRSGHIYILFSALLHVLIGVYFIRSRSLPGRLVQTAGSALLFVSLGLFLYGFFVETPIGAIERPMIRNAIVWSLAGVLLHGIGSLAGGRETAPARTAAAAASPRAAVLDREGGGV
jgi:hypothetical protein